MLRAAAISCLIARAVFADGGVIQLQQQAAPFVITVFASPEPRAGSGTDLSVLVQDAATLDPLLDARLIFQFRDETTGSIQRITPLRERAQNRLLYATNVNLASPGRWPYTLTIQRGESSATVVGILAVGSPATKGTANLKYAAVVPCAIAVFMLHQFLLRRRSRPSKLVS